MTGNLTRSTTRIYGALTALGDGSTDVLERLLPFFEPILRPLQGNVLNLEDFARDVRNTYQWNFNTDVVEVFIPRLKSAGWLTAIEPSVEQTGYSITLPNQILNIDIEATAERQLRDIAEKFQAFVRELSPLIEIPHDVEGLEEILIEWLLYAEAFSENNLNFTKKTVKDPSGTLRQVVEIPQTTTLTDKESFLCARFVAHAIESDPEASETLARIASIGLLTEVVQDFVKPSTPVETSNLAVFLDAPVAMELLGVSGKAAKENTEPVIAELHRIGASIRIFSQSIEEIRQSLKAVLENPRPTGPTAQALARNEVLREYVTHVATNPEAILKDAGIHVVYRKLEQFPSEHAYFTEEHRDEIYGALTFQENPNARAHDADVTTLIMRQRRGYENSDIFKSRFLLMTRNGLLAQLVRRECVKSRIMSPVSIPPVVHRRVVTASIWLRTGFGTDNLDTPKRLLLANCERVLAIRPSVVEEVKRLTDALGDEEMVRQLDVLVSQPRSAQMLMDKTLGAPSVVTSENLGELFQQMLHPHLEEERKKGDEAIKEEKAKGRKRVEEIKSELEQTQAVKDTVAARLSERSKEDKAAVEALCKDVASKLATQRRIRKWVGGALALLFCSPPLFESSNWQSYLSFALAIPLGYSTITGNKWIGTKTSEKHATETLLRVAKERRLTEKISRVVIDWHDDRFQVAEKRRETRARRDSP